MLGAKVRESYCRQEFAYLVFVLEVQILYLEPFLAAQSVEILEREHADVRCIVPFVGEFLGNRHATVQHEASAGGPVTEIRERHDDAPCHA